MKLMCATSEATDLVLQDLGIPSDFDNADYY